MYRPRRAVKEVAGPQAEPVTLAEAKAWAKVDASDDDPLLAALITAATQHAQEYLRRSLITRTLRLTLDLDGSGLDDRLGEGVYDLPVTALYGGLPHAIELPQGPAQSITSVTTYALDGTGSVFSGSGYSLAADGSRLMLAYGASWPSSLRASSACEVLYTAGYGDTSSSVPQPIKTALLMHVQRMYDGRIVCDMPEGCQRLLRPYRIMDGLAHG